MIDDPEVEQQPDDDDELERDRGPAEPDNDEGPELPTPRTDPVEE